MKGYRLMLLAGVVLVWGCGKTDSDTHGKDDTGTADGFRISGTVAARKGEKAGTPTGNKIVAMSPQGEKIGEFSIGGDGTFSIPLSAIDGKQMILLLVDTTARDPGEVLGVISIPAGADAATLDSLHKSQITGDLALGTVTPSTQTDVAASTLTVDQAAFKDRGMMTELATSDNALRLVVNAYENPKISAGVQVIFWMPHDLDTLFDTASDLDDFVKSRDFSGLRPVLNATLDSDITASLVDDKTQLKLYPTDTVLEFNRYQTPMQFDPTHPMTATYANVMERPGGLNQLWIEFPMLQSFPRNHWPFKVGASEVQKGAFVFGPSYPFDGETALIPMPQIRLIRTSGIRVSGVEVKWYLKQDGVWTEVNEAFLESLFGTPGSSYIYMAHTSNDSSVTYSGRCSTWAGTYTASGNSGAVSDFAVGSGAGEIGHMNLATNVGDVSYQFVFNVQ